MRFTRRRRRQLPDHVDCRQVARVLQRYLDGEIDPVDVPAITEHLDACRECGLAEATYDRIKVALAQPSSAAVDPGVLQRLRAFTEGLERPTNPQGDA